MLSHKMMFVITFVFLCVAFGCATPEDILKEKSNYAESNGIAKINGDSQSKTNDYNLSQEELEILKKAEIDPQKFNNTAAFMAETKNQKYNLVISPNPTYSYARVEIFYGSISSSNDNMRTQYFEGNEARQTKYPKVTIDLYYGNEKVHTFHYTNVGSEVDISESYLNRVGTYNIVVDLGQGISPLSASFEVKRR